MSIFLTNVNNITENTTHSNIVQSIDNSGILSIGNDGNDNVSNIRIQLFDISNNLIETLIFPSNADGPVFQGWRVEYFGLSGTGNSCINGGKDWIQFEDGNGNLTYDNQEQCVKLAPMPITYQNQPITKVLYNQIQINWSVASQINNEKYIIEHSKGGRNFSPIGEIAGDGTSNVIKHYEYIHTLPSIGINYYRIKQVDYDGQYSYSDIASVRYDGDGKTNIYPNPATSEVTITTTVPASMQIMDVYGRLLLNRDISEGQNTINISALPSGILIFVVGDQRYRVLKE